MKSLFKVVTLSFALLGFAFSTAQAAEMGKVAVVFPSKILKESPQRAQIIAKLEAEFKDRYEALIALEKSIIEKKSQLERDKELMSESDIKKLKREIQQKEAEYKLDRTAFEEDNRTRQQEEQQKAFKVVAEVIKEVAKKGNYDVILNGEQVVFSKPELDITDKVIQEISKK